MRVLFGLILASFLAVSSGCGPAVPDSELGTVILEVPNVAGADKPYPLPKIPAPPGFHPRPSPMMPEM